jgi:hypothetical protein
VAGFAGGVRVAATDVNGDGRAEIITGPGPGRPSEARVFNLATGVLLSNGLAYAPGFTAGMFVAAAAPLNRLVVESPAAGATVQAPFALAGWAFVDHPAAAGDRYDPCLGLPGRGRRRHPRRGGHAWRGATGRGGDLRRAVCAQGSR